MERNNLQGDLTNTSAKTKPLAVLPYVSYGMCGDCKHVWLCSSAMSKFVNTVMRDVCCYTCSFLTKSSRAIASLVGTFVWDMCSTSRVWFHWIFARPDVGTKAIRHRQSCFYPSMALSFIYRFTYLMLFRTKSFWIKSSGSWVIWERILGVSPHMDFLLLYMWSSVLSGQRS